MQRLLGFERNLSEYNQPLILSNLKQTDVITLINETVRWSMRGSTALTHQRKPVKVDVAWLHDPNIYRVEFTNLTPREYSLFPFMLECKLIQRGFTLDVPTLPKPKKGETDLRDHDGVIYVRRISLAKGYPVMFVIVVVLLVLGLIGTGTAGFLCIKSILYSIFA